MSAKSDKVTIVARGVYGRNGEDALNTLLNVLYRADLEIDANDDVVSIYDSKKKPLGERYDITVRVAGI